MIGATIRRAIGRIDRRALVRALPFVALIVLAAGVSYRYHQLLGAQRDRVDHTYEVLASLDSAFVSMVDAETGQRGYVITGDERYLSPYRAALAALPRTLDRLRTLVVDSPMQTTRANMLEALLRRKLGELDDSIEARRTGGFDRARALIVRDHGKAVMDDIRATLADIRGTETRLLAERTDEAHRTERQLLLVTALCASLSTIARIGLAWGRGSARRREGGSDAAA